MITGKNKKFPLYLVWNSANSPMLKMGLMMMMMMIMMMMAVCFVQIYINVPGGGTGVLRISSDGDDRMGTKIKTQQNP